MMSNRSLLMVFCITGCLLSGQRVPAGDWAQWNGPARNGISEESGLASAWPADGLNTRWSREIGAGFSSLSVAGSRVFAMGHQEGQEIVWCLDRETGKPLWTHQYDGQLLPNLHEGGPCATPTVDGDVVFTLGKEGQLFCLQISDGRVCWETRLQEVLSVPLPEWGFSSSPLILGDQLILEGGRIASFDKTTGRKLWQSDKHSAGYGSAAPFQYRGETLLAVLDCDGLRVVTADAGKQLAFAEWKSPYQTNATTPIVTPDGIFVSTGYDIGCGLFRFTGDALELIYSNKNMRNHFNSCVLRDGWLYGFDGNSHNGRNATLNCLNLKTGELAWKQRGLGCGSLIAADGKLIILAEKGDLVLARASSDAYHELGRTKFLDGRCWTAPSLADGDVYARTAAGELKCVSLPRTDASTP